MTIRPRPSRRNAQNDGVLMAKVSVTMVEKVIDSTVDDAGSHAVLWLQTKDDASLPLAVRCDELPGLIDRCALARAQSLKIVGSDPLLESDAAVVTWWSSSVDPHSDELRLDLTFGGGGTLSFALSRHMAEALLRTLQSHYGRKPIP